MNDIIYLDNAATTFPKPQSVADEMIRCIKTYCGNPGRGSHALSLAAAEKIYECRELAAEMFSCSAPESVVLTANATHALNLALKAYIPKRAHILISDMEHNAVLRPVAEMEKRGDITYDIFSTEGSPLRIISEISSKLRENTAAVISTLAPNICTKKLPSREIGRFCREHGMLFIADGAQAAGHREISMKRENIDILCIPGHKGLYGPQGIGMMITAVKGGGDTLIEGGSGADSLNPFMPEYLPDRFEAGTLNTPAAAGLASGMRFIMEAGYGQIEAAERELWYRLMSKLDGDRRFVLYGDKSPSAVVLINKHGSAPSELGKSLNDFGVCTRSGLHCAPLAHKTIGTGEKGGVRISFGLFNTVRDVDRLCDALVRV